MTAFTPAQVVALMIFTFVASVTPGPNNAMLMASGAKFGLKKTGPHMAGVVLGFALMIGVIGLVLGLVFSLVPVLHTVLKWVGVAYLLWLAWKIATATSIGGARADRPMSFLEVVGFQWINVKAWVGAVAILAAYAPQQHYLEGLAVIVSVCLLVNTPVVLLWAGSGAALRRFLDHPIRLRAFNILLAGLLVATLVPMMLGRS
ncbi:MAG: LysE family translocator [Caulobacteraceae bacterium]|nr:MAG: LysE family translocator [Caulobacteraceae bacterium]